MISARIWQLKINQKGIKKKKKTQNKDYRNGTNYVTDNQGSHAVTNDNKCLWNDLPNG